MVSLQVCILVYLNYATLTVMLIIITGLQTNVTLLRFFTGVLFLILRNFYCYAPSKQAGLGESAI